MKKIFVSFAVMFGAAVMLYAATADKATVATTCTITQTSIMTNNGNKPILIAPVRSDRVGLVVQCVNGSTNLSYSFSTNSLTWNNGYGNIQCGSQVVFDNVKGPVVPQTAVYAFAGITNLVRVIEFRRPE